MGYNQCFNKNSKYSIDFESDQPVWQEKRRVLKYWALSSQLNGKYTPGTAPANLDYFTRNQLHPSTWKNNNSSENLSDSEDPDFCESGQTQHYAGKEERKGYTKVPKYWAHPSQLNGKYTPGTAPANLDNFKRNQIHQSTSKENENYYQELNKNSSENLSDSEDPDFFESDQVDHSVKKHDRNLSAKDNVAPRIKTYSVEIEKSLRSPAWMADLRPYIELERRCVRAFAEPGQGFRGGRAKTSFTYLLLDPRKTRGLSSTTRRQTRLLNWTTFINSIFYIGKGVRTRPYKHLQDALQFWNQNVTRTQGSKVQLILDIWAEGAGVICLHVFQSVIEAEAYTNEAAMIDALGEQNLTNVIRGGYYGSVATWPDEEKRMLGQYLLYKAMDIFLSEGERQIRPEDL